MTAAVSVFNGKLYPVTAQTVSASEVVGWNRETMLEIMSDYMQIAVNLLGILVERLKDIQSNQR
jgi:hypothetical protein